ncbi:MAG: hypothetical protein FWD38_00795 [Oscillospiraceae bacterium]|nr:hypothetical protein [Oscillospiraceae bacterium]
MFKKQVLQNIIGNIIFLGSQWFILILIVRIVGYKSAGMFSLAIAITALFYVISVYGMRGFQVSDIKREYNDQQYMIARWITITIGFFACCIFIFFQDYNTLQKFVIIFWMISKSVEAFSDLVYGYFQNEKRFDCICFSLSIKGIVQIGAFWLGLFVFSDLLIAIVCTIVSTLAVVFIYDVKIMKKSIHPIIQFTKENWKCSLGLLKKCFPLVVVLLSAPLMQLIPRVYFEGVYSEELFGIFSSIAAPTVIFHVLVTSAMIPFIPKFAEYYNNSDSKKLLFLLLYTVGGTIILGVIAILAVVLFGEFVLVLLYGESIRIYSYILYYVVVSVVLTGILICTNSLFIAARKLVSLAATLLFGCCICFIITPFMINRFEMNGIALAMIAGQLVSFILLTGQYFRLSKRMQVSQKT